MSIAGSIFLSISCNVYTGLAAALALQNVGFTNIHIYERDREFHDRRQGFGMTLTNNLTGALAKLGLREECQKKSCPSSSHYLFDSSGQVLGYYGRYFSNHLNPAAENRIQNDNNTTELQSSQGFNLRIPRQMLRQMLYDRLDSNVVQVIWGMKLIDFVEYEDKVSLEFYQNILSYRTSSSATAIDPSKGSVDAVSYDYDILVGCDGIRSIVRELRDSKLYKSIPNPCPLSYLGVSVILGLSTFEHPLINDRGFYVLDGLHRLFIMPFQQPNKLHAAECISAAHHSCSCPCQSRLTMWQLSFNGLTEEEAILLRNKSPEDMLLIAKEKVSSWFHPVVDVISHTVLSEIWATPLYDRNPMQQSKIPLYDGVIGSRVVVLGDACHPMSMFKGQGANQSMEDGPLLAKWLTQDITKKSRKRPRSQDVNSLFDNSSRYPSDSATIPSQGDSLGLDIDDPSETKDLSRAGLATQIERGYTRKQLLTKLKCFERDMIARSSCKVLASREAAKNLHSSCVLDERFGIEGLGNDLLEEMLESLRTHKVGAEDGILLDDKVLNTIRETKSNHMDFR